MTEKQNVMTYYDDGGWRRTKGNIDLCHEHAKLYGVPIIIQGLHKGVCEVCRCVSAYRDILAIGAEVGHRAIFAIGAEVGLTASEVELVFLREKKEAEK